MIGKYYPPTFLGKEFHCPYCNVYAKQEWETVYISTAMSPEVITSSVCVHCNKRSFWLFKKLTYPSIATIEPPHSDMPEELLPDYYEATNVYPISPKASAALVRLLLQKLLIYLGCKGKNINNDIGALVEKGLSTQVQMALDICRIVGNSAVHPGEIDIEDSSEIVNCLFMLINFIVEDQVSRPKRLQEFYAKMPQGKLESIKKRDEKQ